MRCFGPVLAFVSGFLAAMPAAAIDKWTVTDLGSVRTESICVNAATESLVSFSNIYGADRLLRTDWTIYGYGLNNGSHDVVITCAFATASSTRATLVVYSENAIQGGLVSNRIAQEFYAQNKRLTEEWLAEAHDRFGF